MNNRTTRIMRIVNGGLFVVTALGAIGTAIAEDAPRAWVAAPQIHKVLTANDQFRLIKSTYKPGQGGVFHSHKVEANYYLTGCDLRVTMPNGSYTDYRGIPKGWSQENPPVKSHAVKNIGTSDCEILNVELN
jgi:quercetin dioxygenase-like cupin family protein